MADERELTKIGWNWLGHRITTMPVEMPKEPMIAIETKAWMDGYMKCQTDILNLIEEMSKGARD